MGGGAGAGGGGDDEFYNDEGEARETAMFFAPENGNVAFGSALHGWALTPKQFAQKRARLGTVPKVLRRALWDYYLKVDRSKGVGESRRRRPPCLSS